MPYACFVCGVEFVGHNARTIHMNRYVRMRAAHKHAPPLVQLHTVQGTDGPPATVCAILSEHGRNPLERAQFERAAFVERQVQREEREEERREEHGRRFEDGTEAMPEYPPLPQANMSGLDIRAWGNERTFLAFWHCEKQAGCQRHRTLNSSVAALCVQHRPAP